MQLFKVESPIYRFLSRFWDLVKLNALWLLFSLPIITIGAATVAAYGVTLKMADEHEGHVGRQFVQGFKDNWKQGIPLGIIGMVVSYLVYLNLELFNKVPGNPIMFLFAAIIIGFVGLLHLTYAFPLSARYHNTLFRTLRNSSELVVQFFLKTMFLWVIIAILMVLFMFNNTLLFFGIIIGPVSLMLTISGFASRFFSEIEVQVRE